MPVFQKEYKANTAWRFLKFVNEKINIRLPVFYAATSLEPTRYEPQLIAYAETIKK